MTTAPNQQRLSPTVSFSLSSHQVEWVRELASARGVSRSQVVREAVALALTQWAADPAAVSFQGSGPTRRRSQPAPPLRLQWAPEDMPHDE
jgi:Arc/MetJ-type ribon-helix-helix transcriptional regulator